MRGGGVSVVRLRVVRLRLVQDQADNIVGAAVVERLLQGRIDHVVRRGDHVAQSAHSAQIVSNSAKRTNIGHDRAPRLGNLRLSVVGLSYREAGSETRAERCTSSSR